MHMVVCCTDLRSYFRFWNWCRRPFCIEFRFLITCFIMLEPAGLLDRSHVTHVQKAASRCRHPVFQGFGFLSTVSSSWGRGILLVWGYWHSCLNLLLPLGRPVFIYIVFWRPRDIDLRSGAVSQVGVTVIHIYLLAMVRPTSYNNGIL